MALLDLAELADALHFRPHFLLAIFLLLIIDHISLCLGVFNSAFLFLAPCCLHAEIRSIKVILRNLIVVVQNSKLVMLPALQAELLDCAALSLYATRTATLRTRIIVTLLYARC